jgi:hypothetical protein
MEDAEDLVHRDVESGRGSTFADQLVDDLLPDDVDWRRLLDKYPIASLAAAGVGGYFLGRVRGGAMIAALAAFASETVSRNVNSILGEDVL